MERWFRTQIPRACVWRGGGSMPSLRAPENSERGSVHRHWTGVSQNVESSGEAIVRIDQTVLIHVGVVHLRSAGWILGRRGGNVEADLFDVRRRIGHSSYARHYAEDADTAVEPTRDGSVDQPLVSWAREVGMQVVRS